MKISVYLHKYIVDVLKTFGKLSDVINRILEEGDEGKFDICNKPPCEPREGASRYDVDITNEAYLSMFKMYGAKSKSISIRRLLYWFVDYEVYVDLGWEQVNEYIDENQARVNKIIDNIINDLNRLEMYLKNEGNITHAKDLLLELKR